MQSYAHTSTSICAAKNVALNSNREILWYWFGCTFLTSAFSCCFNESIQRLCLVTSIKDVHQLNFTRNSLLPFDCVQRRVNRLQIAMLCLCASSTKACVCTFPSNFKHLSISHGLTWKNNIAVMFVQNSRWNAAYTYANARCMNWCVSFWIARKIRLTL